MAKTYATQQFRKPISKQFAGRTSPLGLVLAAYRGQGSHATVSKTEIVNRSSLHGLSRRSRLFWWRTAARARLGKLSQITQVRPQPMSHTYGDPRRRPA